METISRGAGHGVGARRMDRDIEGLAALLATGPDEPIATQRGHDAEGIPGTVREVLAAADDHAMLGGNARKRGGHEDLLAVRAEDQETPLEESLKRGGDLLWLETQPRGQTGGGRRLARRDDVLIDGVPHLQVPVGHHWS